MKAANVLAIDIGASSMRGILGKYDGKKLSVEEIGRFQTPYANLGVASYWDFPGIFNNVIALITEAQKICDLTSVGIDSFGGCTCFIDKDGRLLENPAYTYSRYQDMAKFMDLAAASLPVEKLSEAAGYNMSLEYRQIQKIKYITAFRPGFASEVDKMLFLPACIGYYLCGKPYAEMSYASAQQWTRYTQNEWNLPVMELAGLKEAQLPPLVWAGTRMGQFTDLICEERGIKPCELVAVAEHDTGSAMSMLTKDEDAAYLSLGTTVVVSVPVAEPILTDSAISRRFGNEGSYDKMTRLTRNINGLFFIRQCRSAWEKQGINTDYQWLEAEAAKCEPNRYLFDPAHPKFRAVGDMPKLISQHFNAELTPGEMVRAIYESLAAAFANNISSMEAETGKKYQKIRAVGGGTQSALFCQCIADKTGLPVDAGPQEAASLGNICVQLIAMGAIADMSEADQILEERTVYQPVL